MLFRSFGEARTDDDIVSVYAVAHLKDGYTQFEVMTRDEVEAIRERSKSKSHGPWVTDFAEMARKTVVKRLCKYLPLSPQLAAAIELDNRSESGFVGGGAPEIDDLAASVRSSAKSLRKALQEPEDEDAEILKEDAALAAEESDADPRS